MRIKGLKHMDAGPELDKLIAEKVMGWEWIHDGMGNMAWYSKLKETGFGEGGVAGNSRRAWAPSSDIAAAWRVVDNMIANGWELLDCGYSKRTKKWDFNFNNGVSFDGPRCDTAPHAICLAALKAVGVEL